MTGQHQNHEPGLLLLERVLCRLDAIEHLLRAVACRLEDGDAAEAVRLRAHAARLRGMVPNTQPHEPLGNPHG